jgi:NTP pyrophosphatase (non-canonical NTP hydrolase)
VPNDNLQDVENGVNVLVDECHSRSSTAGWWNEYYSMPEEYRKFYLTTKLCLIHSEVSEAMEGLRKDQMDDHLPHRLMLEVELADAVIRIADIAGALHLDLGGAVSEKMVYNTQRADHKLENRSKEGGKGF